MRWPYRFFSWINCRHQGTQHGRCFNFQFVTCVNRRIHTDHQCLTNTNIDISFILMVYFTYFSLILISTHLRIIDTLDVYIFIPILVLVIIILTFIVVLDYLNQKGNQMASSNSVIPTLKSFPSDATVITSFMQILRFVIIPIFVQDMSILLGIWSKGSMINPNLMAISVKFFFPPNRLTGSLPIVIHSKFRIVSQLTHFKLCFHLSSFSMNCLPEFELLKSRRTLSPSIYLTTKIASSLTRSSFRRYPRWERDQASPIKVVILSKLYSPWSACRTMGERWRKGVIVTPRGCLMVGIARICDLIKGFVVPISPVWCQWLGLQRPIVRPSSIPFGPSNIPSTHRILGDFLAVIPC